MSFISSQVKVLQIQRQGLDIADIVDWDLQPHLNMCALNLLFYPSSYMHELKIIIWKAQGVPQ